jgi:predicted AlkP superfamily pyrophosphatase or phosphodiesterase
MRGAALFLRFAVAGLLASAAAARAEPVMLISIDGLRPGDVIEAEKRGLKLPNLTRFLKDGAYASGVVGVLPTVTYPSHTTLLTGASPARHGVVSNYTFDPTLINQAGWFWYASDIKLPTLWDAAEKAGQKAANVHWPVSVGAKNVTWNLPQYWRTGHPDDAKLLTTLSTPGLIAQLEADTGKAYAQGIDESITGDENRGDFAIALTKRYKPGFITVYLTALDHEQHAEGPGSDKAKAVLERIDAIVGRLVQAERAAHPDSVIAVASDHGFSAITTEIDLFGAFFKAGLMTLGADGKVASWEAVPWPSGGSAAVVLARPGDAALQARVRTLLTTLKADPANKIVNVIERPQIVAMGGNPQASFFIDLAPEATTTGPKAPGAPFAAPSTSKGMHGYFPASPLMRSTFLIMGPGIAAGKNLGEIDMRAIAPTLAAALKTSLPTADLPPLDLKTLATPAH